MSDTDATCRGCKYQIFTTTTDSTGLRASLSRCGKIGLSTVFARMPFEDAVKNLPMLDPSRWCGPGAKLRQEKSA